MALEISSLTRDIMRRETVDTGIGNLEGESRRSGKEKRSGRIGYYECVKAISEKCENRCTKQDKH
jgi:hypothetical protein